MEPSRTLDIASIPAGVDRSRGQGSWEVALEAAGSPAAERLLDQDEIDRLLGFDLPPGMQLQGSGIGAILSAGAITYERLPMLELVFDRLARLLITSLRNFTGDNVEVSLDAISQVRFGDYLDSVPLPAILAVFRARELDNYGLVTVDSNLIYAILDVLLGGRRGSPPRRIEGRPTTAIERALIQRVVELVLEDAGRAFAPLTPVTLELDRLETSPRLAAVDRPSSAAVLVRLRVDMEDRGGRVEVLLPYATLEPIRVLLLQQFVGEKFGHDDVWERHLTGELRAASLDVAAVLGERRLRLSDVLDLKVGDTLTLDAAPGGPVELRAGRVALTVGRLGCRNRNIAVRVKAPLGAAARALLERRS